MLNSWQRVAVVMVDMKGQLHINNCIVKERQHGIGIGRAICHITYASALLSIILHSIEMNRFKQVFSFINCSIFAILYRSFIELFECLNVSLCSLNEN
jgi:hypothetical protein